MAGERANWDFEAVFEQAGRTRTLAGKTDAPAGRSKLAVKRGVLDKMNQDPDLRGWKLQSFEIEKSGE